MWLINVMDVLFVVVTFCCGKLAVCHYWRAGFRVTLMLYLLEIGRVKGDGKTADYDENGGFHVQENSGAVRWVGVG